MVAISVRLDMGREARMGFAGDSQSVYPIVNSDLSDVFGAPGLPAADVLARAMSRRNHSWKSEGGPEALFLATRTAGVGAFGPFEEHLDQQVGSERVQTTFQSAVCEQATHQQLLRGRPVVGARFRTVSSPVASVVLGARLPTSGSGIRGRFPATRARPSRKPYAINCSCRRLRRLRWSGWSGRLRVRASGLTAPG
jgi:hypothetical protein